MSDDPTGGELTVTWPGVTGTAANGDNVATYTLNIYQGATLVSSPAVTPPSPTESPVSTQFRGSPNSESYTFTVTATNKAGTSPPSAASAATTVFGQPGTVTNFRPPATRTVIRPCPIRNRTPSGQAIGHYEYTENGGALEPLSSDDIVDGLTNGQHYWFRSKLVIPTGQALSNTATATPDAAPTAPSIAVVQGATTVTFSWGAATSNGCPISSLQWSTAGSGGPWNSSSLSGGSTTQGNNYNQPYSVWVLAPTAVGSRARGGIWLNRTASANSEHHRESWSGRKHFGRMHHWVLQLAKCVHVGLQPQHLLHLELLQQPRGDVLVCWCLFVHHGWKRELLNRTIEFEYPRMHFR